MFLKYGLLYQYPTQLPFQKPGQVSLLEILGEKVGVVVVAFEEIAPFTDVSTDMSAAFFVAKMHNCGVRVVGDLISLT